MKKICHITSTDQGSIPRLLRESGTALKMGLEPCIVPGQILPGGRDYFIGVASASGRLQRMLVTSRRWWRKALKSMPTSISSMIRNCALPLS